MQGKQARDCSRTDLCPWDAKTIGAFATFVRNNAGACRRRCIPHVQHNTTNRLQSRVLLWWLYHHCTGSAQHM